MREQTGDRPALVPFPKVFSILGFAVFSALACLFLLETGAGFVYRVAQYRSSPLRQLQASSPPNTFPCRGTGDGGCPVFTPAGVNLTSASPAYQHYSWAEDFWKELRAYEPLFYIPPYEPFRLWGMRGFHGKYLNVDDTPMGRIRRTVNKPGPGCDEQNAVKIWFFGGSTAWGYGTPDFATIPSYLSEKLNAPGTGCVEVINLGVDGYNSNQELIYLGQELKAGWRPDIVIFYDGVNGLDSGIIESKGISTHFFYRRIKSKFESPIISWPGLASRSSIAQLGAGIRRHFFHGATPAYSPGQWASRGNIILNTYQNNLRMARAMGKAYGFEVYAFWQPSLGYGAKPLVPSEQVAAGPQDADAVGVRAVYEDAARRASSTGDFVFLSRIFDGVQEPLFIDYAHLGPRGNEIVAGAIARVVASSPLSHPERQAPGVKRPDNRPPASRGVTAN